MGTINTNNTAYGLSQALLNVFPQPIIAHRAPTVNDKAQLGTVWINEPANTAAILTSIVNNAANWENVTGGAGVFGSLTVTPGPTNITGTTNINVAGAAATTIGTGGTGAVNIGNATGNTTVTGNLDASGNIVSTLGDIVATTGTVNAVAIFLAGGIEILTGAGSPAGVITPSAVGSLYLNTTGASATTRLYIATGLVAADWVNITCAG
jgi:hypothetical protein